MNATGLELSVVLLALGFTGAVVIAAVLLLLYFARRNARAAESPRREQAS